MRSVRTTRFWSGSSVLVCACALATLEACRDYTSAPPYGGPAASPQVVDVSFCSAVQPAWVAFQDGDGTWTRTIPTSEGEKIRFRYAFTSNRAGIAVLRRFGDRTMLFVQYASPAELVIVGDTTSGECGSMRSKTLLGTVADLDTSDIAVVSASTSARTFIFPDEGLSFALGGLTQGPQDILAVRSPRANRGNVTRMILRRTPALPDSATIPAFDFTSPESFAPVAANVTIDGLPAEGGSATVSLRTANAESIIAFLTSPTTALTRPYVGVPDARLKTGDLHILAVNAGSPTLFGTRSAVVYFHSPVDQTLTLGAPVNAPEISVVATAPTLRLRARFDTQSDYDQQTSITYRQARGATVNINMTSTYAGRIATGYDLVLPDLSAVAGFDPSWTLQPATEVQWVASRVGGTLGLGLDAVPVNGSSRRTANGAAFFQP
jgi:hypothetical protein